MARSNALRTTRSFLALIVFFGLIVSGFAFAFEFTAPLPKSNLPERVTFTLKTSTQEFVFFESYRGIDHLRFSRVDERTGALRDQPLLELPPLPSGQPFLYTSTKALALRDGGFVLALSYEPMFMGVSPITHFVRFDADGQFLARASINVGNFADFLETDDEQIAVFATPDSPRLATRISLRSSLPSRISVSAEHICAELITCEWQLARRDRPRPVSAPAEVHVLRKRRVSSDVDELELLRVAAHGKVISVHGLGALAAGTSIELHQFEHGLAVLLTRRGVLTLRFFDLDSQLIWSYALPNNVHFQHFSADVGGFSAHVYDSATGAQAITRINASGVELWRVDAANVYTSFHENGDVALLHLPNSGARSWRWLRADGRSVPVLPGVQTFAFTYGGDAIVVAPELSAYASSRISRLNALGKLLWTQQMLRRSLTPDDIQLIPNAYGVDIAYTDSRAIPVWRYTELGAANNPFQIQPAPSQFIMESADRSFVVGSDQSVTALGPMGQVLWVSPSFGSSGGSLLPLFGGVLLMGADNAGTIARTLDSSGRLVDSRDLPITADQLRCIKITQVPVVGRVAQRRESVAIDRASCFYRGSGMALTQFHVDADLRFTAPSTLVAAGAISQLTDDGGAILTETTASGSVRHVRLDAAAQTLWQIDVALTQALIPTQSGGAWLHDSSGGRPLAYVDPLGVIQVSSLSLTGAGTSLADDSVLLSTPSQITRIGFHAGKFLLSQQHIDARRQFAGELAVSGMRSAWLERSNSRRDYVLRMFDWPAQTEPSH